MPNTEPRPDLLPHDPLTRSDHTTVHAPEVPGAPLLSELPPELALRAWDVLRAVLLFAAREPRAAFHAPDTARRWEEALLRDGGEPDLLNPLAVIVGELAAPARADRPRVAQACVAVAEWALARGAVESALAFFEAAALALPQNGRYALVAGRALKTRGRMKEAERWLQRARKLTRRSRDWEAHVLSTSSLGMLFWAEGAPARARTHLERGRALARRHGLRVLEGEMLHNLLVVAINMEDHALAESYARAALERYLPAHPRLPALAYDTAYYWLTRGHAARALAIFRELLPRFADPVQRFQVLAATARAAGAGGQRAPFEQAWRRAAKLLREGAPGVAIPAALIDLGLGAAHFERWERARAALAEALAAARRYSHAEELVRAEGYLAAVEDGRNPDPLVARAAPMSRACDERHARPFIDALEGLASARSGR